MQIVCNALSKEVYGIRVLAVVTFIVAFGCTTMRRASLLFLDHR